MNCSFRKDGSTLFEQIDSFLVEVLLEPFCNKRISMDIIDDYFLQKITKQDPLFSQDWRDYVAPELQALFTACHHQVLLDLKALSHSSSPNGHYTLIIPPEHRDAWLRTLSIIRLLLFSRHGIKGEKREEEDLEKLSVLQRRVLLQLELFALIQQCLLEAEAQG